MDKNGAPSQGTGLLKDMKGADLNYLSQHDLLF